MNFLKLRNWQRMRYNDLYFECWTKWGIYFPNTASETVLNCRDKLLLFTL